MAGSVQKPLLSEKTRSQIGQICTGLLELIESGKGGWSRRGNWEERGASLLREYMWIVIDGWSKVGSETLIAFILCDSLCDCRMSNQLTDSYV